MRLSNIFRNGVLVAPVLLASVLGIAAPAEAAARHTHSPDHHRLAAGHSASHLAARSARREIRHHERVAERRHGHVRRVVWKRPHRYHDVQCVPYARRVSGIDLTGDAYHWWHEADGRYARGHVPERDAVLSFRPAGRMPLGHVAVVTETVNRREVLVTQANWPSFGWRGGGISKAISVIDVSPHNNWTEVRVEVGHSDVYGAVYRTNGFIYRHPPAATLMADGSGAGVQVAAAPDLDGPAIATSAPDRSLR